MTSDPLPSPRPESQEDLLACLEEAFHPRLRMFFSVDLVGSTSYKSSPKGQSRERASQGARWIEDMLRFYKLFPQHLNIAIDTVNLGRARQVEMPQLWKSQGDELLFSLQLRAADEAILLLHAWKEALKSYGTVLRQTVESLDLKSVVWVAGFPTTNLELFFQGDDEPLPVVPEAELAQLQLRRTFYSDPEAARQLTRDFLGPSIDAGFRLAALCSPRKLMISLELAWIICNAAPIASISSDLVFHFDGNLPLKGVAGGIPYPHIWLEIKSLSKLDELSIEFLPPYPTADRDKLQTYLEAYYERYGDMKKPFIVGCQNPAIGTVPQGYLESLLEQQTTMEKELVRSMTNMNTSSGTPPTVGVERGKKVLEAAESITATDAAVQVHKSRRRRR